MSRIHAALSFNIDPGLIQAALPLFAAEQVEALEWSFDTLYDRDAPPAWWGELLQTYGDAGRLVGHGVYYSLFSGKWLPEQAQWLKDLRTLCQTYRFDHISEHFGWLTGTDFHKGAPLSVPYTPQALAIGRDRLLRLADACGCPVGLENLAFASSVEAAAVHGEFLEALVAPVDGFLILDLHNLYCQLHNFQLDAEAALQGFPLARVREIHISGGSWEPSAHRPAPGVRRDTHDDRVPGEVWQLLRNVVPRLPNLKLVVLEQMGTALMSETQQEAYRADFQHLRALLHDVEAAGPTKDFRPQGLVVPPVPLEDMVLHAQQQRLSMLLEGSASLAELEAALEQPEWADTEWGRHHWDPAMLETARLIARKWKDGFKG